MESGTYFSGSTHLRITWPGPEEPVQWNDEVFPRAEESCQWPAADSPTHQSPMATILADRGDDMDDEEPSDDDDDAEEEHLAPAGTLSTVAYFS
ncbi:hypothetical protein Tco_0200674 [Tanacetum coccineum]